MSDVPSGCTGGDSVTGPNDGEFHTSIHAFDEVDAYDYPYDKIGKDDKNRWFLQGYFDPAPNPEGNFALILLGVR